MARRSTGTSFRYRDRKTGRLVSKSTWKRSKSHGGTRYKREKIEKEETEYQINVKYQESGSNKPEVQISARGPSSQTRQQVIDAVEERRKTGSNPEGWDIRIVHWTRAKSKKVFKGDSGWQELGFFIGQSVIRVG